MIAKGSGSRGEGVPLNPAINPHLLNPQASLAQPSPHLHPFVWYKLFMEDQFILGILHGLTMWKTQSKIINPFNIFWTKIVLKTSWRRVHVFKTLIFTDDRLLCLRKFLIFLTTVRFLNKVGEHAAPIYTSSISNWSFWQIRSNDVGVSMLPIQPK